MKIYTKLVWEWDEEKGLIEKETECFDYEGPLVRCDSDDNDDDSPTFSSPSGTPTAEEKARRQASQDASNAMAYAQQHGSLE